MKAKEAVFLVDRVEEDRESRLRIVTRNAYKAMRRDWDYSFGAVRHQWGEIPEAEMVACVLWTALEIASEYDVPVKAVMAELDKIEGFTDQWNTIGRLTGSLL